MPSVSLAVSAKQRAYWRAVLRVTGVLLLLWFLLSFVGPWFAASLGGVQVGYFPLSFWMAAQGALLLFVAIVAVYALAMEHLDARYAAQDDDGGEGQGASPGPAGREP